jgi:23S rRNA pseudouridine2605 synthase
MRLNQYIAHSGICTRRKAEEFVKKGQVKVNGQVETNPGYQVQEGDEISFKGEVVSPQQKKVYYLFNKPKNTSTGDRKKKGDRKTVQELIQNKVPEKVFPVEQMESASTGLLILTNDKDLAERLTHPLHQVKMVYQIQLEKEIDETSLQGILKKADSSDELVLKSLSHLEDKAHNELGADLRRGSDQALRQLFEKSGYKVVRLDRVTYGGITKKDLPRGFVRPLKEKEVIWLKHFL